MCSRWELEMPPSFKDAWCSLVSNAAFGCWQLCQTIPGWVVIFQGGLRILISCWSGGVEWDTDPRVLVKQMLFFLANTEQIDLQIKFCIHRPTVKSSCPVAPTITWGSRDPGEAVSGGTFSSSRQDGCPTLGAQRSWVARRVPARSMQLHLIMQRWAGQKAAQVQVASGKQVSFAWHVSGDSPAGGAAHPSCTSRWCSEEMPLL